MSAPTLDGMTVEQLRDLAKRANATAAQKEKDEKDKVPPVGTEWEYDGRYWVTERQSDTGHSMTLSIPKKGGPIMLHWFHKRFSRPGDSGVVSRELDVFHRSPDVIAKLALRVQP